VYLARLKAEYKNKKGFVYFYKYKTKKDDMAWKLASVGWSRNLLASLNSMTAPGQSCWRTSGL